MTSRSARASSGACQRSGPAPGTPAARRAATAGRSGRGRRERGPELQPARRAHQLAGDDPSEVRDGAAQLAGGPPAHRHVVLLHRRRRHRVDARRHGETTVLGHHRRLRVLHDHHSRVHAGVLDEERRQPLRSGAVEQPVGTALGDRTGVGHGDRQEVAHLGDRRAVEVAARLHATVGQQRRVVDRRAQLDVGNPRRRARTASRAAPCTWGVHRSE